MNAAWSPDEAELYGTHVVELFCVNLGELVAFVGGKVFEKPAPRAPRAPAKAGPRSVQLCGRGRFREINSAPFPPLAPLLPPVGTA